MVVGSNGKCCLLNWQSKQIERVVRSTFVRKTLAISDAADDGVYLADMISESLFNDDISQSK